MADLGFYSTAAQVIPVLFVAVAVERGFFASTTREKVEQRIRDEWESRGQTVPDSSSEEEHPFLRAVQRFNAARFGYEVAIAYRRAARAALSIAILGMFLMVMGEAAALKITLTGVPSTGARVLCELSLVTGLTALLYSIVQLPVERLADVRNESSAWVAVCTSATTGAFVLASLAVWWLV
jgi:hypothetical protein